MAKAIRIPVLGQSVEEVRLVRWIRGEGETVAAGDPLAEVETDKTNIEWESPEAGTILQLLIPEGAYAPVETPALILGVPGEDAASALPTDAPAPAAEAPPAPAVAPPPPIAAATAPPSTSVAFSPRARRLADDLGLGAADLAGIVGSGPKGRVVERDVQERHAALEAAATAALDPTGRGLRVSPLARAVASDQGTDLSGVQGTGSGGRITAADVRATPAPAAPDDGVQRIPLTGMRRRVAENLLRSVREKPHVTLHTTADASEMMRLRKALLPRIEAASGVRVSPTDFVVWACGRALAACPWMNGHLEEDAIVLHPDAHVGLAVSLGQQGLIVPVIRAANRAGLGEIAQERVRLAERARTGSLGSAEIAGATFTVTNLGTYGVDAFNPIIPPAQIAILGVGALKDTVVAHEGSVAVRPRIGLSLSFDHRAVDGAPAAEFLQRLVSLIEEPAQALA